jgi:predicted component of type VI protein secretion system
MSTSAAVESGRSAADLGILDRIIAETKLTPDDEAYDIAKRGVSAFIEELLKPQNENEPVKKAMVDRMIAEIDAKLSRQMDEILHNAEFQALESSWRGLKLLVDRPTSARTSSWRSSTPPSRICSMTSKTARKSTSPACTSTSTPPSTASSVASRSAP